MFAVLFYYFTDITWGIFEGLKMADLLYVNTTIYFFAMASGVYFWAQYTITYLEDKSSFGKFLVFLGRTVAGLILLFSLVNIFYPIVFVIDENSVYHGLADIPQGDVCQAFSEFCAADSCRDEWLYIPAYQLYHESMQIIVEAMLAAISRGPGQERGAGGVCAAGHQRLWPYRLFPYP